MHQHVEVAREWGSTDSILHQFAIKGGDLCFIGEDDLEGIHLTLDGIHLTLDELSKVLSHAGVQL